MLFSLSLEGGENMLESSFGSHMKSVGWQTDPGLFMRPCWFLLPFKETRTTHLHTHAVSLSLSSTCWFNALEWWGRDAAIGGEISTIQFHFLMQSRHRRCGAVGLSVRDIFAWHFASTKEIKGGNSIGALLQRSNAITLETGWMSMSLCSSSVQRCLDFGFQFHGAVQQQPKQEKGNCCWPRGYIKSWPSLVLLTCAFLLTRFLPFF